MANWYDYPQYFDMIFRDETDAEVTFFEQAFERFADGEVKRIFEPGCGSGRLVAAMAAKGYDVTGLDLSQPMLRYLKARLKRRGLEGQLVCGDMTEFQFDQPFDAVFCTFNTFRHLMDEASALKHLRCVAAHLRPGGLYILGFHVFPTDTDPECIERWRAEHAGTKVSMTLRVLEFQPEARQEMLRISIKAQKRAGQIHRIRSDFPLRTYTPAQAKRMLAKVKDVFEVRSLCDFDYDIDAERKFDNELTDALFVLKRR